MVKDEIVFTDLDLDGAGSYLVHCWARQNKPNVVTLKVSNLREKFLGWLNHNKLEDYKQVYFFDLDTTEIQDLIDKKNVCIFDHHKTHKEEIYKNAEFYEKKGYGYLLEESLSIDNLFLYLNSLPDHRSFD